MATYTATPSSTAHIVLVDGTTMVFPVSASPSVAPHLVKDMKNTGYLTLWNDRDTMCIRADQIKLFSMSEDPNQPTEK